MRICLATRHADALFMPLALLYLKSALVDHAGVAPDDVVILEFPPKATPVMMAAAIETVAPDVLGFSCYVWNIMDLMDAARAARARRPAMSIVLGGPEVGPVAEKVLAVYPWVDVVVKSEGEGPMADLVTAWRTGEGVDAVRGIWRREGGTLIEQPDAPIADLNQLSSPHLRGYVPMNGRAACVETQRGCVFRCSFCFYNKDYSIRNRRFDLDRVKDELRFWLSQDISQLFLMDPVFNLNAARAKDICRFVIEHNHHGVPLHAEVWAEFIDDELAALMKAANFTFLEVGLQTTDAAVLKAVDRRLRMQPFIDGVRRLQAHDLSFELQLIFGLPGDTVASFRESLNFAASLAPADLAAFDLMVLPGTELWRQAESLGLVYDPEPPYLVRATATITAADVGWARLRNCHVRLLWGSRVFRLLSREAGMTFADLVDAWARWRSEGARGGTFAAEIEAFMLDHCRARGIPDEFYRAMARWELAAVSHTPAGS